MKPAREPDRHWPLLEPATMDEQQLEEAIAALDAQL
jgi:hypothetical protein